MKIPASGMLTGRAVEEWVGRTPDSKPPAHVVERIFLRHEKLCHISGREIRATEPWHVEHVIPIWKGGENRELNLAPALVDKHKIKTAKEATERADERNLRQKTYGMKKSKYPMPGSKASGLKKRMDGTVVRRVHVFSLSRGDQ